MSDSPSPSSAVSRRDFLSSGIQLGAALVISPYAARAQTAGKPGAGGTRTINVGLIGYGQEGQVLLSSALKIPDLRFKAVCDIWPIHRTSGERMLNKFGHDPRPFEDYRDMLANTPDLDAVIIATPDFVHAEHTIACLRAGKHVYCEKLMSNTVEGARSMVKASRETGKLLQIGHQRRSNPRYLHALHKLVRGKHILGRVTNVNGQWNRAVSLDLGAPAKWEMSEAQLNKYGYANMHEFLNWRWFKKYAGGPISDLGAHQIDVYNWFLGTNPSSVLAGGSADYYTTHEWPDNVMTIYEFPTKEGNVRAFYQVLTTTSAGGGYNEFFMGDEGALKMSESPNYTKLYREARAPDWDPYVAEGLLKKPGAGEEGAAAPSKPWEKEFKPSFSLAPPRASVVDVRETAALSAWDLAVTLDKPPHQPHIENFCAAIRDGVPLNCPGEQGFASAVTVLKVNEAVAARRMLTFDPKEFIA